MDDCRTYLAKKLGAHFSEKETSQLISILIEDIPGLSELNESKLDEISNRLISGEPVQYVTGIAPFYGYFFEVSSAVLIPRPETEELVYCIEKFIKKNSLRSACILDVGTGSGCIPITLSMLFPAAKVQGVDVSEDALKVARSNNKKLGANVEFLVKDFLLDTAFDEADLPDILVSNPPYIPHHEKGLLGKNVLDHEPHLALFVENDDPLIFYRKICEFALSLNKPIAVFLECNEYNAQEVETLYKSDFDVELIKDLQGKDRIVKAVKGY